uniref:Tudor domain-containing protein n=1 Tax=Panagrellus redivivus TaxID=6233 RepID=A0A7E4VZK7_PANRE
MVAANPNPTNITFPDRGRTSPRLEQVPGDVTKRYIKSAEKIRRLAPRHFFPAEVVYVVSPSNIWVRLVNHITSQLELASSKDLDTATAELYKYVMAPVKPDRLGRARILKLSEDKAMCYVYFIDAGQPGKVKTSELYELPKGFACHPWQTVPLMLHGIDPANGTNWASDEVAKLQEVLDRYTHFWVTPVLSTKYPDDESCFISANINGLTDTEYDKIFTTQKPDLNVGDSIAELYNLELHKPQIDRIDGAAQKSYPYYDNEFYNHFEEKPLDQEAMLPPEIHSNFHLENPFPQLRGDFGSSFLREGHTLWVFTMLSDTSTLEINKPTPNRFFAHRLDSKKGEPNDIERFRRFAEEGRQLAKQMDEFYLFSQNQHGLDFNAVYEQLKSGERVFGIVQHYRKTSYFTMRYQRVEILHCIVREGGERCFYRGRFLDTGGIETFTCASVIHIHPDHMTTYPMCYVLYYSCLSRPNKFDKTWNDVHLEPFNEVYLRPNRVFQVKLVKTPRTTTDLSKPLHVESMVPALNPEGKSIEDLMTENRHAIRETYPPPILDIYEDLRFAGETEATETGMARRSKRVTSDSD